MNGSKPIASLSGSLLARKGGAKPAMRPRPIAAGGLLDDLGWNDMGYDVDEPADHVPSSIAALTPAPMSAAAREAATTPPVVAQQQALADRFGEESQEPDQAEAEADPTPTLRAVEASPEPAERDHFLDEPVTEAEPEPAPARRHTAEIVAMPARQSASAQGRRAAFTLRLDTDRHLRLRLAAAVSGRSCQHLVTAALDQFLTSMPEVGTLAGQLPVRTPKRS